MRSVEASRDGLGGEVRAPVTLFGLELRQPTDCFTSRIDAQVFDGAPCLAHERGDPATQEHLIQLG